MRARDLIRGVIDSYERTQLNIGSEVARDLLTRDIYNKLSKHYHIFKKNELIVDDTTE